MVRSLYTSADIEEDLSITLEPMDRFKHMRGPFRVVFQGQSNGTMVQSKLYTSADMQEDLSISLDFGLEVTQNMALETPKTARASTKT